MGNSSSRDKNLIIYIETDKTFYNSGSNIDGVVFVEAITNFTFDALYIRVEGDQWCQWYEGSSKNRLKHTGSQNFYAVEHLLEKYEKNHLQAGRYAYPFSIELSQNIPGSFQSSTHEAKIEYKLAAYFVNYHQKNNKEIEYIPLLIRQPFRQEMVSYQGTSTQQPKAFCCFSKGKVSLTANFDKNVCYEGQIVHIQGVVNNRQGTEDINKILVELNENIFVSSNAGIYRTYRNSPVVQTIQMKIPKGQEVKFQYDFKIPNIQHQTAVGTLVAHHYRVEVSTQSGFISKDNPCIYSPLFILKKQFTIKSISRPRSLNDDLKNYKTKKMQIFKAPQYWFKKNMNLSVMNFRLEDGMENQEH